MPAFRRKCDRPENAAITRVKLTRHSLTLSINVPKSGKQYTSWLATHEGCLYLIFRQKSIRAVRFFPSVRKSAIFRDFAREIKGLESFLLDNAKHINRVIYHQSGSFLFRDIKGDIDGDKLFMVSGENLMRAALSKLSIS